MYAGTGINIDMKHLTFSIEKEIERRVSRENAVMSAWAFGQSGTLNLSLRRNKWGRQRGKRMKTKRHGDRGEPPDIRVVQELSWELSLSPPGEMLHKKWR